MKNNIIYAIMLFGYEKWKGGSSPERIPSFYFNALPYASIPTYQLRTNPNCHDPFDFPLDLLPALTRRHKHDIKVHKEMPAKARITPSFIL